jgi:hypothetical protein
MMIAFMADMLISENMAVDFDLVPKIILLIIDLWVIGFVLGCEVRCEDSVH